MSERNSQHNPTQIQNARHGYTRPHGHRPGLITEPHGVISPESVPKRKTGEANKGLKLRAAALTFVALIGIGALAKQTIDARNREAPITAYDPLHIPEGMSLEQYDANFREYNIGMQTNHEAPGEKKKKDEGKLLTNIGEIAHEYALDTGMENEYPIRKELTRQAETQLGNHDGTEAVINGEVFMLPNSPHQPQNLQAP